MANSKSTEKGLEPGCKASNRRLPVSAVKHGDSSLQNHFETVANHFEELCKESQYTPQCPTTIFKTSSKLKTSVIINMRIILSDNVNDYSSVTPAILKWSTFKWLLFILKRRPSDIIFFGMPKEMDPEAFLEFWIDSCLPGCIEILTNDSDQATVNAYRDDAEKAGKRVCVIGSGYDSDKLDERCAKLCIYCLGE